MNERNELQEQEKATALFALAENFQGQLGENALAFWLDLLAGYSAQQVQAGVLRVIETYEFKTLPPFAVLKKAIEQKAGLPSGEDQKKLCAESEWALLMQNISRFGVYRTPPNIHPTTQAVLRTMGGWDGACRWTEAELTWRQRDFFERWLHMDGNAELIGIGAGRVMQELEQRKLGVSSAKALIKGDLDGRVGSSFGELGAA